MEEDLGMKNSIRKNQTGRGRRKERDNNNHGDVDPLPVVLVGGSCREHIEANSPVCS